MISCLCNLENALTCIQTSNKQNVLRLDYDQGNNAKSKHAYELVHSKQTIKYTICHPCRMFADDPVPVKYVCGT